MLVKLASTVHPSGGVGHFGEHNGLAADEMEDAADEVEEEIDDNG